MASSWSTDLSHFLNASGNIHEGLSSEALNLVNALCRFVFLATNFDGEEDKVPSCFTTVRGKKCKGKVSPFLVRAEDYILWECESCGSNGTIKPNGHALITEVQSVPRWLL